MTHELAFILTTLNKAPYTKMAVGSMLMQKCEPMLVVLSDNGSTDGTWEILKEEASKYDGPHKVITIQQTGQQHQGMPGLNEHIDNVMQQVEANYFIQLSGDDYSLQGRAAKTLEAFRTQDPSMVLTAQYTVDKEMNYVAETGWPLADSWVKIEEMFPRFVGGSSSQAWSREFYEQMGGIKGCLGSSDVLMPFLSVLSKGCYFLAEKLQCYRKVLGPDNTGLESIFFDIPEEDKPRRMQLEELIHFQVAVGLYEVLGKMYDMKVQTRPAEEALSLAISDRAASLVKCRKELSFMRVPPLPFKA